MRMKALLALLGLGLALLLFAGCSDNNDNENTLRGTVTNAATSLPEEGATVTLFRNGTEVDSVSTNENGTFTFDNVEDGSGYTIVVSSPTDAFADVTFGPFEVRNDISNINIVVGSGVTTGTVSGTITNASTGLPQANATVTLYQGDFQIGDEQITGANGQFSFSGVPFGSGYTIVVSSATSAFEDVTFGPFNVQGNVTNINIVVGSGLTGTTVSGTIGTIDPTAVYDVSIIRNNTVIRTTTAGPAVEPSFTLTNVPPNDNYIIAVQEQGSAIITLYGPVTVPEGGLSGLLIYVKDADQLSDAGVTGNIPPTNGTATIVSYVTGGSTITIDGGSPCGQRNPSFITGVTPGVRTITITNDAGESVTFTITIPANTVLVFRPVF